MTAAKQGDWCAVRKEVYQRCACVNDDETMDEDKALYALFISCFHGHEEVVANLLKEGVKYRKCLPSGLDAIEIAATMGNVKCVESLLRRKVRPHEWNNDRMSLTNWNLQDRIKTTLDRIATTRKIQNNTLYSRLTNSQKYDSALSTWYNGEYGQIYLCEILDSSDKDESKDNKPVFRP